MRTTGNRARMALASAAMSLLAVLAGLTAPASAEPIQEPGEGLMRHFSILHTSAEGLPPSMATIFPDSDVPPAGHPPLRHTCLGSNPVLAQRLPTHLGRVWVVPGRACLTLVQARGEGDNPYPVTTAAASIERAVKRGIAAIPVGLAPDGVIAARFSPTVTVPVVRNVYEFPLDHIHEDLWNNPKLVHGATASG